VGDTASLRRDGSPAVGRGKNPSPHEGWVQELAGRGSGMAVREGSGRENEGQCGRQPEKSRLERSGEERRPGMAGGAGGGWGEGLRAQLPEGRHEPDAPCCGSWPGWPSGRGGEQYPWEPTRTVAFPQRFMGGDAAGGAAGVDGAAGGGGERALRRQARYEKWCNGQRLRALGNANPPGVPELIGRWFLNILEAKS
jgi:hypothetical protein